MRPKRTSQSIYQPASSFALAAGAVALYQATSRQRLAIRAIDTPDSQRLAEETRRDIKDFLALLDTKEKEIIQRHYGMLGAPESYAQIGKHYGVTKQRICEIIQIALKKIRAIIKRKDEKI